MIEIRKRAKSGAKSSSTTHRSIPHSLTTFFNLACKAKQYIRERGEANCSVPYYRWNRNRFHIRHSSQFALHTSTTLESNESSEAVFRRKKDGEAGCGLLDVLSFRDERTCMYFVRNCSFMRRGWCGGGGNILNSNSVA